MKRFAVLAASAALILGACGGDRTDGAEGPERDTGTDATAQTAAPTLGGTLTVSAATSLTSAFTEIGDAFMAEHPDVDVRFNFDASSVLATQITEGAPADVFASADEASMTRLTDVGGITDTPATFARNELVIVTQPGNPADIDDLSDLTDVGVVSLCGEEAPCGKYAKEALANAGVTIDESNITRGQNVGATLTAVTDGDAVAAVVYVTDARNAGDAVDTIRIPDDVNVTATYPIGVVRSTPYPEIAAAFVERVLGEDGQATLADHGFRPPS